MQHFYKLQYYTNTFITVFPPWRGPRNGSPPAPHGEQEKTEQDQEIENKQGNVESGAGKKAGAGEMARAGEGARI